MLSLADEMARHGKNDEAENIFEVLARDPDQDIRNEARYRRAKLLRARSNYRGAALLLRRILDERPDATPVRLELAQMLDRMGDKDGAWQQVRAAQAAGLPPAVARLIDRYSDALRAQRPFGASSRSRSRRTATSTARRGPIRSARCSAISRSRTTARRSRDGRSLNAPGVSPYRDRRGREPSVSRNRLRQHLPPGPFNDIAADLAARTRDRHWRATGCR